MLMLCCIIPLFFLFFSVQRIIVEILEETAIIRVKNLSKIITSIKYIMYISFKFICETTLQ